MPGEVDAHPGIDNILSIGESKRLACRTAVNRADTPRSRQRRAARRASGQGLLACLHLTALPGRDPNVTGQRRCSSPMSRTEVPTSPGWGLLLFRHRYNWPASRRATPGGRIRYIADL